MRKEKKFWLCIYTATRRPRLVSCELVIVRPRRRACVQVKGKKR